MGGHVMFRVDVISEPAAALNPDGSLWGAEARKLAQHDVSLVKPALLFAEHVELVSFRIDMQAIVESDALQHFRMPMRLVGSFAGAAIRRDPDELEKLGLTPDDLCTKEEAVDYFNEGVADPGGNLKNFYLRHSEKIAKYRLAVRTVLVERRDGLIADELEIAISRGVLECSGWSSVQPLPDQLAWTDLWEEFIPYTAQCVVERLAESSNVPFIDPAARLSISHTLGSETLVQFNGMARDVRLPVTIAGSFLTHLPGLSELKVDELLDLRDSLDEYLPAFRGELLDLSNEIETENTEDTEKLGREIERRWHRDISPALQEIRQEVIKARYPRHLLSTFSADKATMTSTATSVVLAAGSVFAGAGALIPAAAAAAFPFVKALNESLKSRNDLRKNRLYFLYGVQQHLKRK
ncbi:hypothetical protein GCM10009787_00950 [Streptomyces bangladeshensis]|uniref:Uncharacterized protein n=2 Tax=Streptomyces bangladeshensis TaxID=295352 RepID=A0ABP5N379_9ACTN